MSVPLTCRVIVVWSLCLATPSNAQTAATSPPPAAPRTTAPSRPEDRAAYEPGGRRDPFVSLAARGDAAVPRSGRAAGVAGLLISELSIRGVLRAHDRVMAIVQGPDQKTFTVHAGDALLDGTVKAVSPDAVIFLQRVDDPLSPVKQREIRKLLRTSEESR